MKKEKVGALKKPRDISHERLVRPNETTKTRNYIKILKIYVII